MYFVKSELMDKAAVRRSLARITHEIIERSKGTENVCIIGVKSRGIYLADILAENIRKFENVSVPVGYIDITSFRDDRSHNGESLVRNTIDFDLNGMKVVLVDDVICTGRTSPLNAYFSLDIAILLYFKQKNFSGGWINLLIKKISFYLIDSA